MRFVLSGVTEDRGEMTGRILSFVLRVIPMSLTLIMAEMSEFPIRCSLKFAGEEMKASIKESNPDDLMPLLV